MIQNIEDLSREREKAVAEMNGYDCRVLVCSGTGCIATGSNKIYQLFKDLIGGEETEDGDEGRGGKTDHHASHEQMEVAAEEGREAH